MKDSTGATMDHQRQGNINKLITPETRQQIRELQLRLDGCDYRLSDLFNNIQLALDIAGQSARCLLTNDPFEAWEKDEFFGSGGKRKNHPAKAKVQKLITPQMRQQIIDTKKRLEDFVRCLSVFFDDVNTLNSFQTALETAEDLRDRRRLETWEARKKRKEEAAKHENSWDWR
jgi:hypothetical protein